MQNKYHQKLTFNLYQSLVPHSTNLIQSELFFKEISFNFLSLYI